MEGTVGRRPPARTAADALGPKDATTETTREQARSDDTLDAVSSGVDMIAGRYKLHSILGRGGVGVVYRARDLDLGEEIAIKVLQGQATRNAQDLERFKREIITARKITHANVIRIHDFGMSGEEAFISMELLSGGTLADRIEDGPLAWKEGLEIAIGICEGLEAAHQMGIIHRDIKPDNVLFDGAGRPKLVDFGLARLASAPTRTIGFSGTPFYVSPEQAEGGEVTGRSDLYSLGVLLFEMFTGRLPFLADNLVRLAVMHANEPPPSPRSIRTDMPASLEAVILRCLSKNASSRYATATEVALDLRAVRDGKAPPGIGPYGRDQATVIRNLPASPAPPAAPEKNLATGAGDKTMPGIPSPPPAPVGALRTDRTGERPSGSARRPAGTPQPLPARPATDGRPSARHAAVAPPPLNESPTELPLPRKSAAPLFLALGGGLALIALAGFLAVSFGGGGEEGAVATPANTTAVVAASLTPLPTGDAVATEALPLSTPIEEVVLAATPAKTPRATPTRVAVATPRYTPKPTATALPVTTAVMVAVTPVPAGKATLKLTKATTTDPKVLRKVIVKIGSREITTTPRVLADFPTGKHTVRYVDAATKKTIDSIEVTLAPGDDVKLTLNPFTDKIEMSRGR